jgi:hypothetical protein
VLQYGLSQIIGSVTDRHGGRTHALSYLRQKAIPHFPGCLLEGRDAALPLVFQRVLFLDSDRQAQFMGLIRHKTGVLFGLFPPKIVVQVGHLQV